MGGRVFIRKDGTNPVSRIPNNHLQEFTDTVRFDPTFVKLLKDKTIESFVVGTNKLDTVKPDHGDLDIIVQAVNQHRISTTYIDSGFEVKTNGSMIHIMFPFKGVFHQLDIIVFKTATEYATGSLFYAQPVVFNAVVGHFARSLGYKFSTSGFLIHLTDSKGQNYYYPLTEDYKVGFSLMGLESGPGEWIYGSPEKFAGWILKSERFDSDFFKQSSNQQSHRDAKSNDFCQKVYDIISESNITSSYKPTPVDIRNKPEDEDRKVYLEGLLEHEMKICKSRDLACKISEFIESKERVDKGILTGDDLISFGLKPGPQFKEILEWVKKNESVMAAMTKEEIRFAIEYNFKF